MKQPSIGRITRWSLTWRLAVALAGIALLLTGSLRGSDQAWPFAPMSQYAFAPPPDDTIIITRVEGELADGQRIELALRTGVSGISRAEVEAHTDDIIADPALLQGVVAGWTARHPDHPQLRQVWLVQETTTLVGGRRDVTEFVPRASWVVPE
ncbi:MAG: hypothetical protein ACR2LI_05385 [Propionibacteriaceae bacterium]